MASLSAPVHPAVFADILIVEDEAVVAMELTARLGDLGYRVSGVADNVIDALVLAREVPPDLVIMDIVLEGHMSGIDAALLFATMRVPVIYVTGLCRRRHDPQGRERAALRVRSEAAAR